jgi:hypothetical protein
MNLKKYLYIALISITIIFALVLLKVNTNNIGKGDALGAPQELKVASDPLFQEYVGIIAEGFPDDFPVYPGAELVGSVINNPAGMPDTSYTVKWHIAPDLTVTELIFWYKEELEVRGWEVEEPEVWEGMTEQVVRMENADFKGSFLVEDEGDEVELIADTIIK